MRWREWATDAQWQDCVGPANGVLISDNSELTRSNPEEINPDWDRVRTKSFEYNI